MAPGESPESNDLPATSSPTRFQFGLQSLLLVVLAWSVLLAASREFGVLLLYWGLGTVLLALAAAAVFGWRQGHFRDSFIGGIACGAVPSGYLIHGLACTTASLDVSFFLTEREGPLTLVYLMIVWAGCLLAGAAAGARIHQGLGQLELAAAGACAVGAVIPMVWLLLSVAAQQNWPPMMVLVGIVTIAGTLAGAAVVGAVVGLVLKLLWGPKRCKVVAVLLAVTVTASWFGSVRGHRAIAKLLDSGGGIHYHYDDQHNCTSRLKSVTIRHPEHFPLLHRFPLFNELSIQCRETPADSFAGLRELSELTKLSFSGSLITDDMLVHIAGLSKLEELSLHNCPNITGSGLKHLAGLPNLRVLYLHNSGVTDDFLRHVSSLSHLKTLEIESTRIGDEGIEHLATLKRLRRLYVTNTNATEQGLAKLRKALPGCEISRHRR
ncbi:MAG: hypothetical protein HQ567_21300 [Candidatus Nealsonbacteria bacterium]|nr:hypothetical protein [Candidatus Nealsonbacteria bacterium]